MSGCSASNGRRVALNLRLGSPADIVDKAAVLLESIIGRKVFRQFLDAERTPERLYPFNTNRLEASVRACGHNLSFKLAGNFA
jgi:hypothetical protein